ncbi:hypothetical protein IFM89_016512 [Coptis chinensis]|uniref:GBF-interacting protein 1 N-terminal domain-containing protein n=1 Tax=Coptis chinensis TaxID=261450 RepID=A0A835IQK0_9MAGN|nr:hypothetical protein IFM89_016512 [Coptis chinensis]
MSNRGKRNSSSSSSSSSSKKEKQGNGAGSCIPKEFMKVVKSMKEIVTNSSEEEIYAVLIECNMDPDEAVQRLLSQGLFLFSYHFHEVKSRREKKKEIKEVSESHSQGLSSGSTPNFVRGGSTGMCTASHSKHTHKDESRSNPMSSSVDSVSRIEETSHLPQSLSSTVAQRQRTATADATKSSQPSAGSQSARLAVSCPLSMADIVKMGTVHDNISGVPVVSTEISYSSQDVQASDASQQSVEHPPSCTSLPEDLTDNVLSWEDAVFQDLEKIQESGISRSQHVHYGEWPLVEQSPSASCPSGLGLSTTSEVYANPSQKSALHAQIANLHLGSHSDEVQVAGDATIDRLRADRVRSDSQTSGQMHISNHSYNIMSPYQHDGHVLNHQKGSREDSHLSGPTYSSAKGVGSLVSSTATNLQQLSLQDGMQVLPAGCAVNISTQLQPPATELPRVSFGTYGSGISATFSRSFPPKAKSDFEEASVSKGASSAGQFDTRNAEYYGHDHLQSTFDRSSVPMQSTFDRSSILRQSTFDRSSVPRTTSSESFEDGLSIYSQLDAAHRHRHAIHDPLP